MNTGSENRTRATLVGGERSHHSWRIEFIKESSRTYCYYDDDDDDDNDDDDDDDDDYYY